MSAFPLTVKLFRKSLLVASLLFASITSWAQSQDSTYYAVQVGAFSNANTKPLFDQSEVFCVSGEDDVLRCFWGRYANYSSAKAGADDLKARGFAGAFPVKLVDGKRELIAAGEPIE